MIHRPDISIIPIHGKTPQIDDSAFIAPGCRIIGDVTIGPEASIWYNCVLRADVSRIVIGARTNIQDGSVVHCDGPKPGEPECPFRSTRHLQSADHAEDRRIRARGEAR